MQKAKRQAGFTQHLAPKRSWRNQDNSYPKGKDLELSAGFIPMLIMIVLILAIVIWLVYSRVSSSN